MNEIQEIEARLAAATPGPWDVETIPETGESRVFVRSNTGDPMLDVSVAPHGVRAEDAEFIAHAPEDIRALLDEVKAVRELHRKVPLYDTPADECTEHDPDIYGIELDYAGEWYCSQHVAEWVCAECFTDDGQYVEYPCDTMRALGVTEQ